MHAISRIQGMKLMLCGVLDNVMVEMKRGILKGCPLTLNLVTWVKLFKELLALQSEVAY